MVDWRFMFLSKSFFNNNCIPHKCITIDDRDPLWMNETTKNKIKLKKSLHKSNKFIEIQKLSTEIWYDTEKNRKMWSSFIFEI